uniref:Uncharacterized protein n=1 Tax=Anguilla anguilla TaxID=7936 RepID=A0A0E9SZN0_ANGAN
MTIVHLYDMEVILANKICLG